MRTIKKTEFPRKGYRRAAAANFWLWREAETWSPRMAGYYKGCFFSEQLHDKHYNSTLEVLGLTKGAKCAE